MKTINKALDEAYKNAGQNAYYGRGFKDGIQFAETWIPVEEELPEDGLRVIVKDESGDWDKSYYSDFMKEFIAPEHSEVNACSITHWRPINRK